MNMKKMVELFNWEGRSIHYLQEGDGKPLLFLHGLGGRAENWFYQIQHFRQSRKVVCLDLPGHGRSEGEDVSFFKYWEVVQRLLDHLGIGVCDLCGLSTGARVGMDLAARSPQRIRHLVVVNAFVHLAPRDRLDRLALYDLLGEAHGRGIWAERLIEAMGVAAFPAISRGFLSAAEKLVATHIQSVFRESIDYDQRPALPQITAPTLLIRGERDGFVPGYCVEELHRLIPASQISRIAECGHLPYLESPESFNRILERFLSL